MPHDHGELFMIRSLTEGWRKAFYRLCSSSVRNMMLEPTGAIKCRIPCNSWLQIKSTFICIYLYLTGVKSLLVNVEVY